MQARQLSIDFQRGVLKLEVDGQPLNLQLLQKLEFVIDAKDCAPTLTLTVLRGDTGVRLDGAILRLAEGEPGGQTFGNVLPQHEGPIDTHEYDPNHGHDLFQHQGPSGPIGHVGPPGHPGPAGHQA